MKAHRYAQVDPDVTHICPTINSLSNLSDPARTSNRAHFAVKKRELKPAYHSAINSRSSVIPCTHQPSMAPSRAGLFAIVACFGRWAQGLKGRA